MIVLLLFIEILVKFTYLFGMIADQTFMTYFYVFYPTASATVYSRRPKAEVFQGQTFGYGRRSKLCLRSNTEKPNTCHVLFAVKFYKGSFPLYFYGISLFSFQHCSLKKEKKNSWILNPSEMKKKAELSIWGFMPKYIYCSAKA